MAIDGRTRKEIRESTVATLIAAGTGAGSDVLDGRAIATTPSAIPAIGVYIMRENAQRAGGSATGPWFQRRIVLRLDCYETASTDADLADAMDTLADEVLDALAGSPSWLEDNGIELVEGYAVDHLFNLDGDRRIGMSRVSLELRIGEARYGF